MSQEISSLKIRIKVLKENIENNPKLGEPVEFKLGDSSLSRATYLDHELQKTVGKCKEAEKKLTEEKRRCHEMVNGVEAMKKVFERVEEDLLKDS